MQHAELGASGAHRWMNCPGSIRLSADRPDISSEYAHEGTAAHSLAERALRKGLDPDVWLDGQINGIEVTPEMVEAVEVFVNYVRSRMKELGINEPMLETRFSLASLNPPADMFGTGDAALWAPEISFLEIDDYKHGVGVVVDAFENEQLMYYALGVIVSLKVKPKTIRVTIVQPRAAHPDGIIRFHEFGWDDLVAFKKTLFSAAQLTLEPDAPLSVGPWCKFCRALPVCPAQHQNAVEVAQAEFSTLPTNMPPPPEAMTQEQLLVVMEKMDLVQDWLKSVRGYVQGCLESGEEIPGWKLVEKRAIRKWEDEEAADLWLTHKGIDDDDRYTRKLLSPAQAEKALRAVAPRGKKKDVALPEELVNKKSSGWNLAPAADTRPAIQQSPGEEFEALPPASDKPSKQGGKK